MNPRLKAQNLARLLTAQLVNLTECDTEVTFIGTEDCLLTVYVADAANTQKVCNVAAKLFARKLILTAKHDYEPMYGEPAATTLSFAERVA